MAKGLQYYKILGGKLVF